MSRRLIIALLIILILGILGGTVALVLQRLRGTTPSEPTATNPLTSPGSLQTANVGNQNVVDNPTGDDDGDGLSNADEAVWNTSRTNPDTDSDGFKDGEEVRANHNPTIAGPSDVLPAGFKPGQNLEPLQVAANAPIPVDQYFASNLDLQGPKENLTDAYNQQYPEEQRTPDTISSFLEAQPIITTLPNPVETAIQAQPQDTPLLLNDYIQTVTSMTIFANETLLQEGLNDLLLKQDPSPI